MLFASLVVCSVEEDEVVDDEAAGLVGLVSDKSFLAVVVSDFGGGRGVSCDD